MLVSTKLKIGIFVILVFVILMSIITYHQGNLLWQQTETMYSHPLTVRRAIGKIEALVLKIQGDMKDIVNIDDPEAQEVLHTRIKLADETIKKNIEVLRDRYLGSQKEVDDLNKYLIEWDAIRAQTLLILSHEGKEAAKKRPLFNGVGGKQVTKIMIPIDKISEFSQSKADEFYQTAAREHKRLLINNLIVLLAIIALSILIGFYLIRIIIKPLQGLTSTCKKYSLGDYDTRVQYISNNEIGVLAKALNSMADVLQSELNAYQNVAFVSAAMLKEERAREFCQSVLRTIVHLSDSQTGLLYMFDAERQEFEPYESLGLKRELLKPVSMNSMQGEIGLALSNGSIHRLKNIPKDTIYNFNLSVGEIKPMEVVSIPVKLLDKVIAVISLSSVTAYSETTIRWINDILPTLAARLNGVLLFVKTSELAHTLEQQNMELEAQKQSLSTQSEELAEQNAELEMQKLELNQASQLKSTFLSNMSHELRTPLNSIIALSGVLSRRLQKVVPEEEYDYIEVIERNGRQLLALINDVLDLSRIEAGKEELHYSEFAVNQLINELVSDMKATAAEKKLDLIWEPNPELPLIVSDVVKCRHILQNLLSNALKFTPEGSVKVSAISAEGGINISVSDTGIGISQKEQEYIFDEFRQADGTSSRKYGGSGLGLSIAKKYCAFLNGNLSVDSQPGKGSVFSLWLPIGNPNLQDTTEHTNLSTMEFSHPSPKSGQYKILIVEDSQPAVIQLLDILQPLNYKLKVAKNGREALEMVPEFNPDAIVLDLMMPEVDGFEVLHKLRQDAQTIGVPVLVLTAKQLNKEDLSTLKSNNVHQLIQKGDVNRVELLSAIRRMLAKEGNQNKVRENIAPPEQDHYIRKGRNASLLKTDTPKVLIVEDNADNLLTIKALLGEGFKILEANDGKKGLELAKQHKPDLILMDIALPVMNGLQALDAIRNIPELADIPIVAVTASVMKGNREETMNYGFDAFVAKPIKHEVFNNVIEEFLYGKK